MNQHEPKKRGRGRPKLSKAETKGRIVPVRFSPEEIKRITAAAKASKVTVSALIRSTMNAMFQS